jgi:hypothetical protein
MIGLLCDAWNELARNWMVFVKCLWPLILVYALGGLLVLYRLTTPLGATVVMSVLSLIVIALGAVAWHRHIILQEKTTWLPRMPDMLFFAYLGKILLLAMAFGVISKVTQSFVSDVFMPILGATTFGAAFVGIKFAPIASDLMTIVLFVLAFGSLMLSFPEGALDADARGAGKTWPANGRRQFLQTLIFIYVFEIALRVAVEHLAFVHKYVLVFYVIASHALMGLALSLLTVAYRRNLEQRDVATA